MFFHWHCSTPLISTPQNLFSVFTEWKEEKRLSCSSTSDLLTFSLNDFFTLLCVLLCQEACARAGIWHFWTVFLTIYSNQKWKRLTWQSPAVCLQTAQSAKGSQPNGCPFGLRSSGHQSLLRRERERERCQASATTALMLILPSWKEDGDY